MKDFLKRNGSSLVLGAGVSAVCIGVGMIYLPAGIIAAGVMAIAWWVLDSLEGDDE